MKIFNKGIGLLASVSCLAMMISCGDGSSGGNKEYYNTTPVMEIEIAPSSGVMLQGFNWSSNSDSRENTSTSWYAVVKNNASEIQNTFEYVWFPPASDSGSSNGYMPRQLNILNTKYGSETELKQAISSISPSKAICDIVINHRVGTNNWGTFTNPSFCEDYYAICSNDEGFSSSGSDMYNSTKKGKPDTGEGYGSARDLDHTNWDVQDGIVTWMKDKLKAVGFVGWRYDYVKGFDGRYVGYYNAMTNAAFSVGEHWPTDGFDYQNPQVWASQFENWVNATKSESNKIENREYTPNGSRVFDFVTKGMLNQVFGCNGSGIGNGNYNLLANEYCGYKRMPSAAVTFVDNHDTGSTQALWYLDPNDVGTAYAFILTHPGYPCVAWQHYFTAEESCDTTVSANASQYIGGNTVPGTRQTYHDFIKSLIDLRKEVGITEESSIVVWNETGTSMYLAQVTGTNGSLIVNIGAAYNISANPYASSYELAASGTNFNIWKSMN